MNRSRPLVVVAVLIATFLTALDTLVVGTAMPTIIGTLGGLHLYSWVFSAYLLTTTVTVPIYGKLADLYGRKPVFTAGTLLFLGGSMLCGLAQSMEQLIVFRAVAGLGAGAVMPVTMTIIGDIFTLEQRARIQGIFSAVWGVASILGPAVGGFLTDYASWRWIFLLNIPVGLAAIGMLSWTLHERVQRWEHQIDYAGAALLAGGIGAVLLVLLWLGRPERATGAAGGSTLPEWSALALLAAAVLCLMAFVRRERAAPEPLLHLELLKQRIIALSNSSSLLAGAALFGINSFVPPFVQGVMGYTATGAGVVLAATAIGWPVGSVVGGRLLLRAGYRATGMLGMALILAGTLLLTRLTVAATREFVIICMAVVGLGMGFCTPAAIIAVQNAVPWQQRGVVTSLNQFSRTIGGMLGVSLIGAAFNLFLGQAIAGTLLLGVVQPLAAVNDLLDPAARAQLPVDALPALRQALGEALVRSYWLLLLVPAAGLVVAAGLPGGRAQRHALAPQAVGSSQ